MKWAPNPYALAHLLGGRTDAEDFVTQSGEDLDKVLIDTFVSRGKHKTVSEAFAGFRQVAEFDQSLTLDEAMRSPHVNKAAIARSDDQFRTVVPALLRISDDVFEGHVFAASEAVLIDDVSYRDPVQGLIGDCYLISAMIALAWAAPTLMTQRLSEIRLNAGHPRFFRWRFHNNDAESSLRGDISVTGQIPMAGKLPRYARANERQEFWPGLLEKAYVIKKAPANTLSAATTQVAEPEPVAYQSINNDTNDTTPSLACQELVGGRVRGRQLNTADGQKIFSDSEFLGPGQGGQLESGVLTKPVMAWTFDKDAIVFWDKTGLWPNHAYAVLGVMKDARHDHIVLRNPHGYPTEPREGYACDPWKATGGPDRSNNAEVQLNTDGVFAITREMFYKHFEHIGWVELQSPT